HPERPSPRAWWRSRSSARPTSHLARTHRPQLRVWTVIGNAVSKLAGEHYSIAFWKTFGLETIALRYFNVFGPYQNPESKYSAVIPAFVAMIQAERPLEIHGDGLQARDFTYVDDVVNANKLAAIAPASCAGCVFNVARGETRTVLEIADT